MTKNVWFRTVLGLILAVLIAFSVNQYLNSLRDEVDVVVAAKDIPASATVTADMLSVIKVNASSQRLLSPNAFHVPEDAVNAYVLQPIKAGEVITTDLSKLVPGTTKNEGIKSEGVVGKSYLIPGDKRAISIKLDAEGSVDFYLKKGDRVDVVYTSTGSDMGGVYSSTILQNIEVFDLQSMEEKNAQGSVGQSSQNITLLASPAEAQKLTLAKRTGKIDFVLHSKRSSSKPADLLPSIPQHLRIGG